MVSSHFVDALDFDEITSSNNPLVPFTSDPSTHEQCFNVTIIDDDILENVEMFSLVLSVAGNSTLPVTVRPNISDVTIVDRDGMMWLELDTDFSCEIITIQLFFHYCSHPCGI